MDDGEGVQPKVSAADAATLAAQETCLADREEQLARDQRQDAEASTSRWTRRLHEKIAASHDRAEMEHRDAAERYTAYAVKF